jgi:hypothetical protein
MRRILFAVLLMLVVQSPAASPRAVAGDRDSSPSAVAPVMAGALVLSRLAAAAPDVNPEALALALEARDCALRNGAAPETGRLALIDYSRPSTEPRMWVFDLREASLLYAEHVAHGRGSGENTPSAFSNREGSHQSSLGLFVTGGTYHGGNGYSLRMDGLEPGINDAARQRAIVIHGAPYVDPVAARRQGRLGRSLGCPALRPAVARELIDTLKDGQMVFAYYPDRAWLDRSQFIGCRNAHAAR